ncbi:MAG TPA: substrate-binding domain-containing protein [Solirubrobacteraceae bacterium]|nr:substrate-binding domain-containing protein [Solirubrobacteraceae bacterium]
MIAVGATAAVAATVAITGTGSAVAKTAKLAAAHACGFSAPVGPANPSGIYKTLSPALKAVYSSDPGALDASPWAHSKPVKGPWKIGYIAFAATNPYNLHVIAGLKSQFAKAKAKGLVTGSLVTNIPATITASTPEQEIAAVQQMVRQGINAIIMEPIAGAPLVPAIDAAGKAGVPVILTDIPLPQAKYGVVVWSQNQTAADAGALGLIQKGNILIVRGLAGNPNDVVLYDQKIADLKYCPNIKVAASIYGDWDNASAKTAVSQYLAAHPGGLDGVLQDGGMMAGTIDAFQSAGQKVPVISDGECQGGDLSWWLANKSSYKTVGGCFNGYQGAYVFFNTALRILAGDGPKYQTLEIPAPIVTSANISTFATPGLPLTSPLEQGGPITAWCTDACLNAYFNKKGTPGGL